MDIRVSGHQIDTGEALQSHATQRLSAIVDKYFNRALSSHVTFGRAPGGGFRCDIIMHVMHNLVLKATGSAQDAHLALDQAAEKIDKQLRRYKRRLKDRHGQLHDLRGAARRGRRGACRRPCGHRRNPRRYPRSNGFRCGDDA